MRQLWLYLLGLRVQADRDDPEWVWLGSGSPKGHTDPVWEVREDFLEEVRFEMMPEELLGADEESREPREQGSAF